MTITVEGLNKEFGDNAEAVYDRIALVAWGHVAGRPALGGSKLSKEHKAAIDKILKEARAEFKPKKGDKE